MKADILQDPVSRLGETFVVWGMRKERRGGLFLETGLSSIAAQAPYARLS